MALSKLTDIRKSLSVEVEDLQVNGITTFTGSVSIGGTLTYQDVTNIDSVGLITARAGVNVSGGQLDVGSNIKLGNAGVITATSFTGSGANLTSLPAANLTGTLPAIDGSNLTGIDADKIQEGNSFAEILDTGTNGIFRFLPENSEVFRITHEAKVGINTNNPSHNLDISADGVAFPSAAGSTILRLRNSAGSATLSIDANAGNVSAIQFGDTAAASQGTVSYNHSSNHLQFNTGGSERLRITSDGKMGFGANSPDTKVHIYEQSGSGSCYLKIQNNRSRNAAVQFTTSQGSWYVGQGIGADVDRFMVYDSAEKFSIDANGHAKIHAGNLEFANGNGIDFSAVPDGSRSISTDGNKFDDYEEGSFTPFIRTVNNTTEPSYSHRVGLYTKIGRLVTYAIRITTSGELSTGSGATQIHGLPFNAMNWNIGDWPGGAEIAYYSNLRGNYGTNPRLLGPYNNNTYIRFHTLNAQTDTGNNAYNHIFTNNTVMIIYGQYFAA